MNYIIIIMDTSLKPRRVVLLMLILVLENCLLPFRYVSGKEQGIPPLSNKLEEHTTASEGDTKRTNSTHNESLKDNESNLLEKNPGGKKIWHEQIEQTKHNASLSKVETSSKFFSSQSENRQEVLIQKTPLLSRSFLSSDIQTKITRLPPIRFPEDSNVKLTSLRSFTTTAIKTRIIPTASQYYERRVSSIVVKKLLVDVSSSYTKISKSLSNVDTKNSLTNGKMLSPSLQISLIEIHSSGSSDLKDASTFSYPIVSESRMSSEVEIVPPLTAFQTSKVTKPSSVSVDQTTITSSFPGLKPSLPKSVISSRIFDVKSVCSELLGEPKKLRLSSVENFESFDDSTEIHNLPYSAYSKLRPSAGQKTPELETPSLISFSPKATTLSSHFAHRLDTKIVSASHSQQEPITSFLLNMSKNPSEVNLPMSSKLSTSSADSSSSVIVQGGDSRLDSQLKTIKPFSTLKASCQTVYSSNKSLQTKMSSSVMSLSTTASLDWSSPLDDKSYELSRTTGNSMQRLSNFAPLNSSTFSSRHIVTSSNIVFVSNNIILPLVGPSSPVPYSTQKSVTVNLHRSMDSHRIQTSSYMSSPSVFVCLSASSESPVLPHHTNLQLSTSLRHLLSVPGVLESLANEGLSTNRVMYDTIIMRSSSALFKTQQLSVTASSLKVDLPSTPSVVINVSSALSKVETNNSLFNTVTIASRNTAYLRSVMSVLISPWKSERRKATDLIGGLNRTVSLQYSRNSSSVVLLISKMVKETIEGTINFLPIVQHTPSLSGSLISLPAKSNSANQMASTGKSSSPLLLRMQKEPSLTLLTSSLEAELSLTPAIVKTVSSALQELKATRSSSSAASVALGNMSLSVPLINQPVSATITEPMNKSGLGTGTSKIVSLPGLTISFSLVGITSSPKLKESNETSIILTQLNTSTLELVKEPTKKITAPSILTFVSASLPRKLFSSILVQSSMSLETEISLTPSVTSLVVKTVSSASQELKATRSSTSAASVTLGNMSLSVPLINQPVSATITESMNKSGLGTVTSKIVPLQGLTISSSLVSSPKLKEPSETSIIPTQLNTSTLESVKEPTKMITAPSILTFVSASLPRKLFSSILVQSSMSLETEIPLTPSVTPLVVKTISSALQELKAMRSSLSVGSVALGNVSLSVPLINQPVSATITESMNKSGLSTVTSEIVSLPRLTISSSLVAITSSPKLKEPNETSIILRQSNTSTFGLVKEPTKRITAPSVLTFVSASLPRKLFSSFLVQSSMPAYELAAFTSSNMTVSDTSISVASQSTMAVSSGMNGTAQANTALVSILLASPVPTKATETTCFLSSPVRTSANVFLVSSQLMEENMVAVLPSTAFVLSNKTSVNRLSNNSILQTTIQAAGWTVSSLKLKTERLNSPVAIPTTTFPTIMKTIVKASSSLSKAIVTSTFFSLATVTTSKTGYPLMPTPSSMLPATSDTIPTIGRPTAKKPTTKKPITKMPITKMPTEGSESTKTPTTLREEVLPSTVYHKSKTVIVVEFRLSQNELKDADKMEVIVQQYAPKAADFEGITALAPVTWYDVHYKASHKYRRYLAKVLPLSKSKGRREVVDNDQRLFHLDRIRREADKKVPRFKAGEDTNCLQKPVPCNGPLEPGVEYRFQLFIYRSGKYTPTPFTKPYKTGISGTENTPTKPKDAPKPKSLLHSTWTVVVIGVLAGMLLVVILLMAVILHRRKTRRGSYRDRSDPHCTLMSHLRTYSTCSRRCGGGGMHSSDSNMLLKPIIKGMSRPVHVKDFTPWVQRSAADSDFRFAEEFESIRDVGRDQSHEASDMPENRGKNRYINVLAYDHTRVKLSYTDDEAGSDYINANYVHGYKQPRTYIATQGPLPGTTDDFWRMVWEQNSHVIVMITQCVERTRVKCHTYWPGTQPIAFGEITVSLLSEYAFPDWVEREFLLEVEGEHPRNIRHFQYTSWPDHGVPKSSSDILEFIQTVRSYVSSAHGPMIVHCSAGVGRSGTFIAIDTTINRLQEENTIDIYLVVCLMRMQRCCMVQTEDQYIFIHRAILDYLKQRDAHSSIFKGYSPLPRDESSPKDIALLSEEAYNGLDGGNRDSSLALLLNGFNIEPAEDTTESVA